MRLLVVLTRRRPQLLQASLLTLGAMKGRLPLLQLQEQSPRLFVMLPPLLVLLLTLLLTLMLRTLLRLLRTQVRSSRIFLLPMKQAVVRQSRNAHSHQWRHTQLMMARLMMQRGMVVGMAQP
jgi:hypothetical protein